MEASVLPRPMRGSPSASRAGNATAVTTRKTSGCWRWRGLPGRVCCAGALWQALRPGFDADVMAIKVADYGPDLGEVLSRGLAELGVTPREVRGKRILLKPYLDAVDGWLGPVTAARIRQRGEDPAALRSDFILLDHIEAHQGIRLKA